MGTRESPGPLAQITIAEGFSDRTGPLAGLTRSLFQAASSPGAKLSLENSQSHAAPSRGSPKLLVFSAFALLCYRIFCQCLKRLLVLCCACDIEVGEFLHGCWIIHFRPNSVLAGKDPKNVTPLQKCTQKLD